MNYHRIYAQFILDRRSKEASILGALDRHHILPKALGGTDDAANLINLSVDDHLFAHILLARIHGGFLVRAAFGMLCGKRYAGRASRREYRWLRERGAMAAKEAILAANDRRGHGPRLGIPHTEEAKAKMREKVRASIERRGHGALLGRKMSDVARAKMKKTPEHRAKIGAASRGRKHTEETKEKQRLAAQNRTPEHQAKITAALIGKMASDETRAKMSTARRGRPKIPEHVAKIVAASRATRERRRAQRETVVVALASYSLAL